MISARFFGFVIIIVLSIISPIKIYAAAKITLIVHQWDGRPSFNRNLSSHDIYNECLYGSPIYKSPQVFDVATLAAYNQINVYGGSNDMPGYAQVLNDAAWHDTFNHIIIAKKNNVYADTTLDWPAAPPYAPTSLVATAGTYSDKILLRWGVTFLGYQYELRRNTVNSISGSTKIYDGPNTYIGTNYNPDQLFAFNDTTAIPGKLYYYWVRGKNGTGSGPDRGSVTGYASLLPPVGITASDGAHILFVRISWTTISGIPNYEVWRNTVNNSSTASKLTTVGSTGFFDDMNVAPGTTYYYWIKAVNDAMTSGFSASDSGMINVPSLSLSSGGLSNTVYSGYNATSQYIHIWNNGGGSCNYSISNLNPWVLSIDPSSGSLTGQQNKTTFSYLTGELPLGVSSGNVMIYSTNANNSPLTLPLIMNVIPAPGPIISLSTTILVKTSSITLEPSNDIIEIWNSGLENLTYSITSNTPWISINPPSGSSTGEHDSIIVTYNTTSLGTGTYSGSIVVSALGAANSPQQVGITMTVSGLDVIIDNDNGYPTYTENGTWYNSSVPGYYGSSSRYTLTVGDSAVWTPLLPSAGIYNVYVWYPAYSTRATNVPFVVHSIVGDSTFYVNQQTNGSQWLLLGIFQFVSGTNSFVRVTRPSSGQAGADAIKFSYLSDPTCDTDKDGMIDGDEIIAGSSIFDNEDFFRITEISFPPNESGIAFSWNGVAGRFYGIRETTNLLYGPWIDVPGQSNIPGTGSVISFTNAISNPSLFYKINVRVSP